MVARTLAGSHTAPVRRFLYTHTLSSPGWSQYGAGHGFELPLLFGPLPAAWGITLDEGERMLSDLMVRAWTGFARDGSPLVKGIDAWPTYDPALDSYLVLDTPPDVGRGFRKSQCDFWDRFEPALYP